MNRLEVKVLLSLFSDRRMWDNSGIYVYIHRFMNFVTMGCILWSTSITTVHIGRQNYFHFTVDCDTKYLLEICIAPVTGLINGDFAMWYVVIILLSRGCISPDTGMEDKDRLIVEQKLLFYTFLRRGRKEKLEGIPIFNLLSISLWMPLYFLGLRSSKQLLRSLLSCGTWTHVISKQVPNWNGGITPKAMCNKIQSCRHVI
jgi:hypothetical protein